MQWINFLKIGLRELMDSCLKRRSTIVCIHIGDLLVPPNGQMTGRLLIASRVLDLESQPTKRGEHYIW